MCKIILANSDGSITNIVLNLLLCIENIYIIEKKFALMQLCKSVAFYRHIRMYKDI